MLRRRPNITFDRTAGSHALAAAGQRARSQAEPGAWRKRDDARSGIVRVKHEPGEDYVHVGAR